MNSKYFLPTFVLFLAASLASAQTPIANISSRITVGADQSATIGFVITGTTPHRVLLRAVGPGLAQFGLMDALSNPLLTLFQGARPIATSTNWGSGASLSVAPVSSVPAATAPSSGATTTQPAPTPTTGGATTNAAVSVEPATIDTFRQVGAFGLQTGSSDAAFVATLPPGAYTLQVESNPAAGVVATTRTAFNELGAAASTSSSFVGPTAAGASSSTGSTTPVGPIGTTSPTIPTATIGGANGVGTVSSPLVHATGDVLVEVYFID